MMFEIFVFCEDVDWCMEELFEVFSDDDELYFFIIIGIEYEQQYQELLVIEIKYIFGINVCLLCFIYFVFSDGMQVIFQLFQWVFFDEGFYEMGNFEGIWCWDNEFLVYKMWIESFVFMNCLIIVCEYFEFMEDDGYSCLLFWMVNGWVVVCDVGW